MNSKVFSPLLQLDLKEEPEKQKFKESVILSTQQMFCFLFKARTILV